MLPEHWGVNVYLLRYAFVHVRHQEWDCWLYGDPIFSFLWNIYTFCTVTAPASIPASGAGGLLLFVDVYSPILGAPQVLLVAKNLPANAGDISDVGSVPGSGGPLEKEMASHSSFLAWRLPWTEEHGELQSSGDRTEATEHD